MPSHSKKQHNFMEAIAHSPSFAKKVHIPQSVGKDYAAADKGKTFSKGSEMKESKGMVGKEVAFFKKKGAPKSMLKHEEAEMKGMKRGGKVRRMAEGGDTDMSMGYGDPFAKPRDYDKEKAQGADSLKRLKGFFGFGDKEESKPSMTMDRPSSGSGIKLPSSESSTASTTRIEPQKLTMPPPPANGGRKPLPPVKNPESDNNDKKPSGPQFSNSVSDRGEGELSGDGLSPAQGPKAPQKRKPIGVEKTVKKERVITAPNDNSYASMEERRAKASESRMLDKKPSAMTRQMREAPSISDLYKGQKSMGDEIGDALKSFRSSIRGGLKSAADKRQTREAEAHVAKGGRIKAYAEGGKVKRMRYGGDTGMDMGQPMRGSAPPPPAPRGMPMPAAGPEMNPNSIAYLQSKYGMRPQGGPPMKAGGSVKKMAEGGFTREADGVAKKGKTQGKVVKMAKGGFVKNADGCAQRGKTKAFQVKMKNGGMC